MGLVTFLVTWPFTCIGLCFTALIIVCIIMFTTGMAALSEADTRDYLVWEAEPVENFDKRNLIMEYVEKYGGATGDLKPLRSQIVNNWYTTIVYRTTKDQEYGLLSKANLLKVRQTDKSLKDDPDYNSFCIATSASNLACDPTKSHVSVVNLIEQIPTPANLDDLTQDEIISRLKTIATTPAWTNMQAYFGKEMDINAAKPKSNVLRSTFIFAGPIEIDGTRYKDKTDRDEEQ